MLITLMHHNRGLSYCLRTCSPACSCPAFAHGVRSSHQARISASRSGLVQSPTIHRFARVATRMKKFILRSFISLIPALALVFAFGCAKQAQPNGIASAAGGPALVKVRFQTDWYPQPEHGGYYQALAKGYYAAEGLDVEIVPGGPNAQVMALVATGRADLGMTNGDDVIVAVARGVPIKMVAAEMQRDPQGILFHAEHPLHS